jgi:hypothetical protein
MAKVLIRFTSPGLRNRCQAIPTLLSHNNTQLGNSWRHPPQAIPGLILYLMPPLLSAEQEFYWIIFTE